MKASYRGSGFNYLPVILHPDGRKETIFGDALVTKKDAKKYAQIEINDRNERQRRLATTGSMLKGGTHGTP